MTRLSTLLLLALISTPMLAQNKKNRIFNPPENPDKSLPFVLVIGDSISIGYGPHLKKELDGVANYYRPATNCGPSTKGLTEIDSWLGDRHWDLVQLNHGLHDLKYMGPNGENLADPDAKSSHQQVPPEQYEANLRKLVTRIKKQAKVVVFCETTPVPKGAKGRVVGDSEKYNAIARKVMEDMGCTTNGLYKFASENVPTREANVHYTPENSKKLAKFLADNLKQHLDGK